MLFEDRNRWSSFCTFWLSMDQGSRRRMCRERMDSILKVVVKNFFIEKEVTSTLVMDSLYSGLKAVEGQINGEQGNKKYLEEDELQVPIVGIDKDMFVLMDDVLPLLERAAIEPLPPEDEKGPQNRTKDGSHGTAGEEFDKDSIERDERRLTELGRRTIEIFVLAHIFSKIEVAYQEAVALKRQEELIREEAAWLIEGEQKVKRGAADKEKKKKKQAKQKRNNRKMKDKERDDELGTILHDETEKESFMDKKEDCLTTELEMAIEKPDVPEFVFDVSDSVIPVREMLLPDSEERDPSSVKSDTDALEVLPPTEANSSGIIGVQNGRQGTSPCAVADSSSTCSDDLVPFSINVPFKGNSPTRKNQKSLSRGRESQGKVTSDRADWVNEVLSHPSEAGTDVGKPNDALQSLQTESLSHTAVQTLQGRISRDKQHVWKKEEEVTSVQKKFGAKYGADVEISSMEKIVGLMSSLPRSPSKCIPSTATPNSELKANAKPFLDDLKQADKSMRLINSAENVAKLETDSQKAATPKPVEKPSWQKVPSTTEKPSKISTVQRPPATSRPPGAPLIPGPRPTASMVSVVPTAPLLTRSVSAACQLGPEPTSRIPSYVQQSYRNVMMGSSVPGSSPAYTQYHSPKSVAYSYSQAPALISTAIFSHQSSDRIEPESIKPSISFGMENHNAWQNGGPARMESPQRDSGRSIVGDHSSQHNVMQSCDLYRPVQTQDKFPSGRQSHGVVAEEFPHMGIIDELLNDEHGFGNLGFQSLSNGPHHLNRQFSFPDEIGMPSSLGSSRRNSCRFERTQSYHSDVIQNGCGGASPSSFHMPRDEIPPVSPQRHLNGQIDGLIPAPWQMDGSGLPVLNIGNKDSNGYSYPMQLEDPNVACGINRYALFRH
ncbi:Hypothetical predicted protein [Olea europaea subsp. europaea]|nr:Hypothetical predicted protein [Olea europaea subsp. europaea]